ncbi:MAG: ABC transporter ATP-binding protein [Nitriliruptoraceae bacterium]
MTFSLEAVVVRRHARTDLDHVDLAGRAGSLSAVVGGDGAGKTTLLRTLVGALTPSAGQITTPARERIGYVPASSGVYPDLSVAENLRFSAAAFGSRGEGRDMRTRELLAATGLTDARDRLAGNLSGGMRQKLAFACAMLHAPDLLVMDEPTTGLDPMSRSELWRLVSIALGSGTAAVFATTYVEEAARADHVLVLDRGRTLVSDAPAQVIRDLPGQVVSLPGATPEHPSWRRGRVRHAWIATGPPPSEARAVEPDLEDAVIVKALAARMASLPEPLR